MSNRKVLIRDVEPGMVLGMEVITASGTVALEAGTVLTDSLINRLERWNIDEVVIWSATPSETTEPSAPAFSPKPSSFATTQRALIQDYEETVGQIKHSFETMRYFKQVPLREMRELAETSIESMVNSPGVVNYLYMMKRQDDYTFYHSVNVSVLCGVLGRWLGYAGMNLKNLILAGLLHDIGKSQIPMVVLNKPGKLSPDEMAIMKLHPMHGYQLIKDRPDLPPEIIFSVLQHHERVDGSGYPLNLKAERIYPYAKVIAVADIYDAMTSDRVYHDKVSPFSVVEMLVQEMFGKLDAEICTVFLNNVRDYFVGNVVSLSNGTTGEVVYLSPQSASRPIIKLANGAFVDLEKDKDISIISLLNT